MLSSTEQKPLEFSEQVPINEVNAHTNKIGWLHTLADTPGASFDITIKDGLGRVKLERTNCKSETDKYGELINQPTLLGEKLFVEVSNLKGAKSLKVFIN